MKRHPLRTLLPASLGIGTLDLLFAWGYWARNEVSPVDILQSIAAGWYGRASYQMGTASAGPFTIGERALSTMIERVMAAPPATVTIH